LAHIRTKISICVNAAQKLYENKMIINAQIGQAVNQVLKQKTSKHSALTPLYFIITINTGILFNRKQAEVIYCKNKL